MHHEEKLDIRIEDLDPWRQVKFIAEHLAYFGWDKDYVDKLYEIAASECRKGEKE